MTATLSEKLTAQFYRWETRCRGWEVYSAPVELEPPFEPFFFHRSNLRHPDDGLRPTVASSILDFFTGTERTIPEEPEESPDSSPQPYQWQNTDIPLLFFTISFPKSRKIDAKEMEQLLCMLTYARYPISFEIIASNPSIIIQVVCREPDGNWVESQIGAYFPDSILQETEDMLFEGIFDTDTRGMTRVVDFGLSEEFMRPLTMTSSYASDPFIGLFGILEHLEVDQFVVIQILFQGAKNAWAESIIRSVTGSDGKSFFIDDPEMVHLAEEKISCSLFGASIRVVTQATSDTEARKIIEITVHSLTHVSNSSANALLPLATEAYTFDLRLQDVIRRQSHRLGMLLNSKELVTLVHFPGSSVMSAKLIRDIRKTKALPVIAKGHPLLIGINEHRGVREKASISEMQRLMHMHIIGATGTGKSSLLQNLILQDITQGNGVAVLDPHGDLIESIIARIPKERYEDVMVIDPADADFPIGFNILSAHSDIEKDTLASDLVAAFRRLSTSWGDQMNSVLANAILAFLESEKGGTLLDLRRFLIEKVYRETFLKTVTDPSIVYYWQMEYPLLKSSSIGPILTRLDTFLRPKMVRNMVAQQKAPDFERILNTKKILLVKLSQGLIGAENSSLLGTFIVSKLQQAAMARQAQPKEQRSSFFVYIDEFQNFITPSMTVMLSGARKYGLGLTLAHQDMQQLSKEDAELAASISANIGTRICFRIGDVDARKFETTLSAFDAHDLQNLATGEAIVRIDRSECDFTIATNPLPNQDSFIAEIASELVIARSREKYGTPKADVEELLALLHQSPPEKTSKEEGIPNPPSQSKRKTESVSKKSEIDQDEVPEIIDSTKEEHAADSVTEEETTKTLAHKQVKPALIEPVKTVDPSVWKNQIQREEQSKHRYLQTLVKRMAESRGYVASIEQPTPDGSGRVDVSIERKGKRIAVEVCSTTSDTWEIHNIEKCLRAGYDLVVTCSTDEKALQKIRKIVSETIDATKQKKLLICAPEVFFLFLDEEIAKDLSTEELVKGYRVKVDYSALSDDASKQKRENILNIIGTSIRNRKK